MVLLNCTCLSLSLPLKWIQVGVQSEIEDPNKAESSTTEAKSSNKVVNLPEETGSNGLVNTTKNLPSSVARKPILDKQMDVPLSSNQVIRDISATNITGSMNPAPTSSTNPDERLLDWSLLAGALEDDFNDDGLNIDEWEEDTTSLSSSIKRSDLGWDGGDNDDDGEEANDNYRDHMNEAMISSLVYKPRRFVAKTCRSELVDALLSTQGDVTDKRFLQAVDILSKMYSSEHNKSKALADEAVQAHLNGTWVSLSKPSYSGCLGKNDFNEYIYTLGKMSFNMFKPGNLKCSVQHTLNNVKFVCSLEEAPVSIPWSLRRELAMFDADNHDNDTMENRQEMIQSSTLRSYE